MPSIYAIRMVSKLFISNHVLNNLKKKAFIGLKMDHVCHSCYFCVSQENVTIYNNNKKGIDYLYVKCQTQVAVSCARSLVAIQTQINREEHWS